MAVNIGVVSKRLVVSSTEINKDETSTMLLLMNAVAESKNKNFKKSVVEFNQSYIETGSSDDLFLSKLLELNFQDLEILYQTLCSSEKKRRSSKQHEKKGSFKKKTSVGDISFANAGYEGELKSSSSTSSLGRKRSQVSLSDENIQGKSCLRKAFSLARDMLKNEVQSEAFTNIVNIHLRVENYYSCTVHCIEFKEKSVVAKFLCMLDDAQSFKMSQICLFIASKETHGNAVGNIKTRLEYSKLANRLQPNAMKPVETLCKLYRLNEDTEFAFTTAKTYLDEVNSKEESIILLQLMCLTDTGKHNIAKTHLNGILQNNPEHKQLRIMLAILSILSKETEQGIEIITSLGVTENKVLLVSTLELLKTYNLQTFVFSVYNHINQKDDDTSTKIQTNGQTDEDKNRNTIAEQKLMLILAGQLLAFKSFNSLEIAKIYIDCLYICGELDVAQAYLIKLVKEYPHETLPMIYLANIRLKAGAYIASTEDFRALLKLYGESQLAMNLSKLSIDERKEIERVHRLHGFRFLGRDAAFQEASECFTIGLCAIGPVATGLMLSRGYCYMHLNNFKCAAYDFQECLKRNESLTSALCARAVLYAVTTHVEEALNDFRKAFSIDSLSCQQCLPKLPLEHVLTFSQMLIQYIKQGLESVGAYKKKTSYDINEISKLESNENNEIDKEIVNYSEFLCKVFPSNIEYVSTYIECLHFKHDKINMRSAVERAVTVFPGEPLFYAWKGVVLAEQRKFDEAITQIKDAHNENNDEVDHILSYLTAKARSHVFDKVVKKANKATEKNKFGVALNYYNIAIMLYNNNVDVIRGRMLCFDRIGESKKWLKDISKVIQLEPSLQEYCVRAGHYQKQGEDFKACEDYMSALEINENETIESVTINSNGDDIVKLFHNTAVAMVELNKTRTAVRLCDAGLKFDPNHKGLRQLKERSNVNRCSIC